MDAQHKDRFRHRISWPGRRTVSRGFLVEAVTLAALTAVLLAIVFGLYAWGAGAWLVIVPIPVLAGALRRPRHGWLVALEFALAVRVLADRALALWGPLPAGPFEPFPVIVVEALLFTPLFWPLVVLGRALGEATIGRARRRGPSDRLQVADSGMNAVRR